VTIQITRRRNDGFREETAVAAYAEFFWQNRPVPGNRIRAGTDRCPAIRIRAGTDRRLATCIRAGAEEFVAACVGSFWQNRPVPGDSHPGWNRPAPGDNLQGGGRWWWSMRAICGSDLPGGLIKGGDQRMTAIAPECL